MRDRSLGRLQFFAVAVFSTFCAVATAGEPPQGTTYTDFVDPFVGTDGTGHTFPGPAYPFGMVQPGPDNANTGWAYTSGYQYQDKKIIGFSQTRASGTGIPELGDVLVMPDGSGDASFESFYDKNSEAASPGYYRVRLPWPAIEKVVHILSESRFH